MELRKDYILNRWVIISRARGKRPKEFKKEEEIKEEKVCYFCPGNENLTPPEIGRVAREGGWQVRWFANKFPAVDKAGEARIKTADKYFTYADAYGDHEIIVETPEHEKQLADLSAEEIKEVLKVYAQRIRELSKDPAVKYVLVFKNHGRGGGTSLVHTHTQVISYNKIPEVVGAEIKAVKKYKRCPYCEVLNIEKGSDRRCLENRSFVAFTPYASRFNYEVWVFPKKHIEKIEELSENQFLDLARIMKKILVKLKELGADYNFFLHYGKGLHFHLEITPRIAVWGGFELSSGTVINSVSPEEAAIFYRE